MRIDTARSRLQIAIRSALDSATARVTELKAAHRGYHPARVLERRLDILASFGVRLERAAATPVDRSEAKLARLCGMLRALGPESAFQRGFSLTLGPDGRAVRSAASLQPGDVLVTRFAEGSATSAVTGTSTGRPPN
jgi:exodeoxyribonuclease VII large subunit